MSEEKKRPPQADVKAMRHIAKLRRQKHGAGDYDARLLEQAAGVIEEARARVAELEAELKEPAPEERARMTIVRLEGERNQAWKDLDAALAAAPAGEEKHERCGGCGNEIDPTTCCCGEFEKDHRFIMEHPFVPMGCDCLREKKEPPACPRCARLEEALREIAKGAGPYSMDRLTHAENCIDAMKELAEAALRPAGERGGDDG